MIITVGAIHGNPGYGWPDPADHDGDPSSYLIHKHDAITVHETEVDGSVSERAIAPS